MQRKSMEKVSAKIKSRKWTNEISDKCVQDQKERKTKWKNTGCKERIWKRSVPSSRVGSGPMGAVTNVYKTNRKVKQNGGTLDTEKEYGKGHCQDQDKEVDQ